MSTNFAEFVAESFHSEVSLTWKLSGTQRAVAWFDVDTIRVDVTFEQREPGGPWHLLFETTGSRVTLTSGVHSSFEIFNGVFQAVQEFLEIRQPEVLGFATKKEKLAAIYETYLRREKDKIEQLGYAISEAQRIEPYVEYRLTQTRDSEWKS